MVNSQGLSSYGGFSFKKRLFSEVNISRSKANFDPKPPPMENMEKKYEISENFQTSYKMINLNEDFKSFLKK
jgi:hypothetical protein